MIENLNFDVLSNTSARYAEVDGDVHFGSMTAKEAEQYRGSIVINTEEELFYPSLTVGKVCHSSCACEPPLTWLQRRWISQPD